ncbi:outer-membrane lipoprotein LolB [Psychromonas marina]|uniref:Outer-membrane lipoprotein LolB n=1 Tax=Psychromonas marina TaxID=88364 RepID=A0ABQ6E1B9_9GAMM|nr:lipoprotein insertase outer membrane protein LolB [Psychromonas marina]GLS91127.1 outer-membrane lipoprotein LolB [Psychromonas marina]
MKYRFYYLLLPLLFSGCAQLPKTEVQQNSSWATQQAQLEQLTDWSFSGKLAIITPEERNSVNIHWQQTAQQFHIRLTTFLGMSVLEIQKNALQTVVIDADGKHYVSDNSEQLIKDLSGMELPINQLQQWIKGNPSDASYQLNENHQVSHLLGNDQTGGIWVIDYSDYRSLNNTNLPHRLQLTRDNLRLKFAISKWEITAPTQTN